VLAHLAVRCARSTEAELYRQCACGDRPGGRVENALYATFIHRARRQHALLRSLVREINALRNSPRSMRAPTAVSMRDGGGRRTVAPPSDRQERAGREVQEGQCPAAQFAFVFRTVKVRPVSSEWSRQPAAPPPASCIGRGILHRRLRARFGSAETWPDRACLDSVPLPHCWPNGDGANDLLLGR